ncbi:MAG: PP2C family serine/threonine-protein phosphatase [Planctomycetota bacterium]
MPDAMPRATDKPFRVEHATLSDLGMRRTNNQDAVAVDIEANGSGRRGAGSRGDVFMVADGMGAHAAGELASKLAVDTIPHAYKKQADLAPQAALRRAVRKANELIHAKGQSSHEFNGMGTTCSCLLLLDEAALVAHVGDSRVYRLRGDRLEQLTFDHSLVWELAAASRITADKVPACIPKNVITRSLGPHDHVNVDLEGPFELRDGDTFLICSDGLTAVVEDDVIGAIIGAIEPQDAGQTLVDIANLRGGPDNISVVIARVGKNDARPAAGVSSTALPKVNRLEAGVPPATWATAGACAVATAWFWSQQEYAWAVAAGVGLAASALIAMWQRGDVSAADPTTTLGGPYGDGPYRHVDCVPGEPAAVAIGAVVEELAALEGRDASEGGPPVDDWRQFHEDRHKAVHAAEQGDMAVAVQGYGAAVRGLMEQVRANQTVDYDPMASPVSPYAAGPAGEGEEGGNDGATS